MDMEAIIQRITDEVYAKLQESMGPQGANALGGAAHGAHGGISSIATAMRTDSKLADILAACKRASAQGMDALCVPQWFVETAVSNLPACVKVATIVGLPGGQTSSFAKYAEAKQAVVAGASVLLVPLNMKYCKADAWESVQADLKDTLTATKGKAQAMVLIEADMLTQPQLQHAAKVCKDSGVQTVLLSYVTGGAPSTAHITAVRQAGLEAGVFGASGARDVQETCKQAGASIFTSNALL